MVIRGDAETTSSSAPRQNSALRVAHVVETGLGMIHE
jgi:hypothetical protein